MVCISNYALGVNMLDTPDFYKKISEIAKEQVQYDIENNLIPDYSQFDLQHAEKVNKRKYMAVIERLVTKCPINTDYEKHKLELQEYTKKYIDESFPLMLPETMDNLIRNYKQNEFLNILNPPLQAFILYVELIRQLYFYLQEKYIKKIKDNQIILTHNFVQYSLELLNGICSLLLGGNHNSVISVYRTFYENYIVFAFIQRHSELTEAFIDHVSMDDCILQMEQSKLTQTVVSDAVSQKYDFLISKYGEDFKDSYGWANSVIVDKNKRSLKTMFEESDLGETFNFYYKLSCKYSHSTAFSLMVRPNFDQIVRFLYGIADITYKEISVILNKLNINSTKEKTLLADWLGVATENMLRELNKWYGE